MALYWARLRKEKNMTDTNSSSAGVIFIFTALSINNKHIFTTYLRVKLHIFSERRCVTL